MGVGNRTGSFRYVNIKKGQIAIKEGEEVKLYGYVEGFIRGLEVREDEYKGDKYHKLCVNLVDESGEIFQLQFRLDSGYGRAFCCILPNIDLTKSVMITPTYEVINDKPKSGMFINQGGKAIKWAFTKDNPNGMPPLERVTFKNKEMIDNSAQQQFFMELISRVNQELSLSAPAAVPEKANAVASRPPQLAGDEHHEPVDDLPF